MMFLNSYYYLNYLYGPIAKSFHEATAGKKEAEKKSKELIKKMEDENSEVKKKKVVKFSMMNKLDEINRIASSRGFFFQTGNIYGGRIGIESQLSQLIDGLGGHLIIRVAGSMNDKWNRGSSFP